MENMYENIIELHGKKDGPSSMILVGVHGDERCGIEAIGKILPSLKIQRGRVLIGYGNPKAVEQNVRFVESNLNRLFRPDSELSSEQKSSYEYSRVQFLKKYFNQADVLFDVHASSIPNSERFVICEKNAKEIVKYLPVNLLVSGFDNVEPGGTDYYMNSMSRIGICLECGFKGDLQSTQMAEESILAFLKARGHIANNLVSQKQSYVKVYKKYFAKTNSFTLSKPFANFEVVKKNQLIGIDGQEEVRATKQSLILFAHNASNVGDEVFLLGEKKKALCN